MMHEFEKLNELYIAIRDIDKIIMSDSKDKLDDLNNAIKNIDKNKFDKSVENDIIFSYRDALVKIYENCINELNSNIKPNDCIKDMLKNKTEVRDERNNPDQPNHMGRGYW